MTYFQTSKVYHDLLFSDKKVHLFQKTFLKWWASSRKSGTHFLRESLKECATRDEERGIAPCDNNAVSNSLSLGKKLVLGRISRDVRSFFKLYEYSENNISNIKVKKIENPQKNNIHET